MGLGEGVPVGRRRAGGARAVFLRQLMASPAFHWLTLPLRIVLAPYFATGFREFAVAIVPALLFMALHYLWVCSTEAHFEEGSIALAEKRAAVRAAALRGEAPKIGGARPKARSGPFPLAERGPPEVAFLWKNLLSMRSSLFGRRLVSSSSSGSWDALSFLGPLLEVLRPVRAATPTAVIVMTAAALSPAYTVLLGPQVARQDLRGDLAECGHPEDLPRWRDGGSRSASSSPRPRSSRSSSGSRSSGRRPRSIRTGQIAWLTPGVRLTAVLCLGLAAPLLCLIQLIVPNTIMVLFPGGTRRRGPAAGGIEVFGQRLIFGVVQLLFALLAAVPAGGWPPSLVIFASQWLLGAGPAVVLAPWSWSSSLRAEAAVGLWWLGERFERFDLSGGIR
jgi:hypothetical protein